MDKIDNNELNTEIIPEIKRVTLHPLTAEGETDLEVNLYPKTLLDGIVDREGKPVEVQEKLISGETIKTINGESVLGDGDIETVDAYAKEESDEKFLSKEAAAETYETIVAADEKFATKESVTTDLRKGTGARSIVQLHGADANEASGQSAIALGKGCIASAIRTVTIGDNLIGNAVNSTYVGQFNNYVIADTLFEVGNGTSPNNRSNAFAVFKDGHAEVKEVGAADNSVVNKKYVDSYTIQVPRCPTAADGIYVLQATVSNGVVTYNWVLDTAAHLEQK